MKNSEMIDAVFTYVDGNDPKFLEKLNFYKAKEGVFDKKTNANSTRFESVEEILYSIVSIFKFASFVDKVYIVTFDQKPNYEEFISKHYPKRLNDIQIIDHKDLFGEHTEIYPTFCSDSIETFLHKIPNLKENYIYFNDDTLLIQPIQKADWFLEDKPIFIGRWKIGKLLRHKKYQKRLKRELSIPMNYTYRNYLGARLVGFKYIFPYVLHTPKPFSKSLTERAFKENEKRLLHNASFRFRNPNSFSTVAFYSAFNFKHGIQKISFQKELYIDFSNEDKNYLHKKLERLKRNTKNKYLCIQSLNKASKGTQNKLISTLEEIYNAS